MTASGHSDLPNEQGNASTDDATCSGLKTAIGHCESNPGVSGSGPRTVTALPESESEPDATGSSPKTATGHTATARRRTATETRPAADALDREQEAERERVRRDRSRELALRSFLVPRSEDRETREDRERERASEDSPDSPRRRPCCDERGEATEEAAWAGGVRCERATSPFPAPEGAEEAEARSLAPDERPETLPPLSLDRGRAGGEEASRDAAQGAFRDPPS